MLPSYTIGDGGQDRGLDQKKTQIEYHKILRISSLRDPNLALIRLKYWKLRTCLQNIAGKGLGRCCRG